MKRLSSRQILVILFFVILGVFFSVTTNKPWDYIPSSVVVGVLVALYVVKNEKILKRKNEHTPENRGSNET